MSRGKILTIEGIDGSGKETQSNFLALNIITYGDYVKRFNFPRYDTETGRKINDYLLGKERKRFEVISKLFAQDRLEAKVEMEEALGRSNEKGRPTHIINDRYMESNLAYQGAKNFERRQDIWNYLKYLELTKFKILPSDFVYVLDIPAEFTLAAMERQGRDLDINETNLELQKKVRLCYLELASKNKNWRIINCLEESGKRKSPNVVSAELFNLVVEDIKR